MPFVRILPSIAPPAAAVSALLTDVSRATAEHLEKSESAVMVRMDADAPMVFAGSAEPCCHVDVHLIGAPTAERAAALNAALCAAIGQHLRIEKHRVFVVLSDVPRAHWGVNGRMLA